MKNSLERERDIIKQAHNEYLSRKSTSDASASLEKTETDAQAGEGSAAAANDNEDAAAAEERRKEKKRRKRKEREKKKKRNKKKAADGASEGKPAPVDADDTPTISKKKNYSLDYSRWDRLAAELSDSDESTLTDDFVHRLAERPTKPALQAARGCTAQRGSCERSDCSSSECSKGDAPPPPPPITGKPTSSNASSGAGSARSSDRARATLLPDESSAPAKAPSKVSAPEDEASALFDSEVKNFIDSEAAKLSANAMGGAFRALAELRAATTPGEQQPRDYGRCCPPPQRRLLLQLLLQRRLRCHHFPSRAQ